MAKKASSSSSSNDSGAKEPHGDEPGVDIPEKDLEAVELRENPDMSLSELRDMVMSLNRQLQEKSSAVADLVSKQETQEAMAAALKEKLDEQNSVISELRQRVTI